MGASPTETAACVCFGTAVGYLAFRIALKSQAPWIKHGWEKANLDHIKELWKPSLAAMAFPLGQALSFEGPRLVIGAIIGPAAVAVFVAHRQLVRFGTLALSFGSPLQAELALSYGRSDIETYQRQALHAVQILVWISFLALLFASSVGVLLFSHWTSGRIAVHHDLLWLLALATMGEAIWRSLLLPINAINRHVRTALRYMVICLTLLIPILYFLTATMGLMGTSLALLIVEVVMIAITFRESIREFGGRPIDRVLQIAKPPISVLIKLSSDWQRHYR